MYLLNIFIFNILLKFLKIIVSDQDISINLNK